MIDEKTARQRGTHEFPRLKKVLGLQEGGMAEKEGAGHVTGRESATGGEIFTSF